MTRLIMFARYEVVFLLAALAAIVLFQIFTGRIITRGLLSEKGKEGVAAFSPTRLQLLLFTLGVGFYVLGQVMNSIAAGKPAFPEIDLNVMLILGGSHALFLGAKALPQSGSKPDVSNQ
ncbi:MAG: hypothetical protein H7Z16_13020 [Pyrinomonadaceae bacterium]|nr:hypothetical protein [Pyrinomonadaceae bacterium]